MPSLKIAGADVENVQVGSTEVNAVYVGSTKLWERGTKLVVTNDSYYEQADKSWYNGWHKYNYNGYSNRTLYWGGDSGSLPNSSISPTTFTDSPYSGSAPVIDSLYHLRFRTSEGRDDGHLFFDLNKAITNSGWTTMKINGNNYNRADALLDSGNSRWYWADIGSNPFTGTTTTVLIT